MYTTSSELTLFRMTIKSCTGEVYSVHDTYTEPWHWRGVYFPSASHSGTKAPNRPPVCDASTCAHSPEWETCL